MVAGGGVVYGKWIISYRVCYVVLWFTKSCSVLGEVFGVYEKSNKVKGKLNLSLSVFLIWAPRHEDVLGEWKYSSTHSLTSPLDGGEWPASRPGHFTPRERTPGTHWIGGWVGPRAGLDAVVKIKIPIPCQEPNPPVILWFRTKVKIGGSRCGFTYYKILLTLCTVIHFAGSFL
jgi:hypothetical protein